MRVAAPGWRASIGALIVAFTCADAVACAADRKDSGSGVLPRAQADEFVRAHNAWRRRAGAPPLDWAEDLAASAHARAVYLAAHGCVLTHGPLPLEGGQNLYKAGPLRSEEDANALFTVTPTMVVEAWAAESADYSPEHGTCAPTRQCLHYTQIVWPATEEVGCGMSVCPTLGQVWVCNYRPAGNINTVR